MRLTVLDCYARKGYAVKPHGNGKRGRELAGPCPGCGGRDRFIIWPEQNEGAGSYHCRAAGNGCGKSGDVIQFLMDFDGLSFPEASRAAGREAAAYRPKGAPRMPRRPTEEAIATADVQPAAALWREKAANFAANCHAQLLDNPEQLAWLAARGLPRAAVRRFGLGWNGCDGAACLYRPRKVWGLPEAPPKKAGESPRPSLWLPRGLVIPARNATGQVERLRIRRTDADRAAAKGSGGFDLKFYVVPGSGMAPLYIPQLSPEQGAALPPGACAAVVESELDAMALAHAAGDLTTVLGLMTARVRSLPPEIMHSLRSCSVILAATDLGDADQAGAKGAALLTATFPQARRWPCVGGKDPGQMAEHGRSLRNWILAGLPDSLLELARQRDPAGPAAVAPAEPESAWPDEAVQPDAPVASAPLLGLDEAVQPDAPATPAQQAGADLPAFLAQARCLSLDNPADFPLRVYLGGDSELCALRALHTLRLRGLAVRPHIEADGRADFTLHGHERWSAGDNADLLFFIHHNGHHVAHALSLEVR